MSKQREEVAFEVAAHYAERLNRDEHEPVLFHAPTETHSLVYASPEFM